MSLRPLAVLALLLVVGLVCAAGCAVVGSESARPPNAPVTVVAVAPRTVVPTVAAPTAPPAAPTTTRVAATVQTRVAGTASPGATAVRTATPLPATAGGKYVVQPGDTLFALSRRFGVPVVELATLNHLPADGGLRAGQEFLVPEGFWSDRLNIRVLRPGPGAIVRSPVVVEGTASTFESVVEVEVLGPDGARLAHTATRAAAPDMGRHGPFSASLPIPPAAGNRPLTVRVYWASPRDGAPLDEVRLPITLAPTT